VNHSFIAPRPKRLISGELRLVLFFFTVTIMMVLGTYLFLEYKTYSFTNERQDVAQKQSMLNKSIKEMKTEIKILEDEVKISDQITTDNTVMKESIRNLFDLVPDDITLDRAELDAESLILYGMTPNKDTYEYMLHAPLRSIFHRTYTSFYPVENGWYRFVSSNYLDTDTAEEIQ
jgi:cell division protein FtsL